jgi:hypothetical protein
MPILIADSTSIGLQTANIQTRLERFIRRNRQLADGSYVHASTISLYLSGYTWAPEVHLNGENFPIGKLQGFSMIAKN